MKNTDEKYEEMGFTKLEDGGVVDRHGATYYPRKVKSPLKAIRHFCFSCMGMDRRDKKPEHPYDDVKGCTDPICPLFDFRTGKNPFMVRTLTEEQRRQAIKNLKMVKVDGNKPKGSDEDARQGVGHR
jgi:hypothetical protein